jgi:hypothetical protein
LHGFASHDSDDYQPALGEISTQLRTGLLNRTLDNWFDAPLVANPRSGPRYLRGR